MRITLAIARNDYGRPELGDSYEYTQWFGSLSSLGHDVQVFDTFGPKWRGDPPATGRALLEHAASVEPDLVLMMLIEDEIPMAAVDQLRSRCQVANWFADDTWRFFAFSKRIAHHFDWVVTTCRRAERAYARMPDVKAYFSPWGYNPEVFHPVDVAPSIDVGFVGQRYGTRGSVIERLAASGLNVVARGSGWPGGRLEPAELATQFASTRINLNFLECSAGPLQRLGIRMRGSTRFDRMVTRHVAPPTQLKARPFEITACGGFVLTNLAAELPDCFRIDEEIAVFDKGWPLHERIEYFLSHEDERRRIAQAGLERSAAYSWPVILGGLLETAS